MGDQAQSQAPTRGVQIELDKARYLRYPVGVLKQLRSDSDLSLGAVLLLGLQADDPTLTLAQIEDLVDLENMHTLFEPMRRATGGLIDLTRLFKKAGLTDPQTPAPAPGAADAASV